ncbi:unnamed protein product [Acanthoscelides obtectus]|uniref:Uncharacterized protein n=1 Tax=Acanthoscelides obtectus TaxID=200917 RepID=A0A9P0MDG1_ACAOB|nr:unnamed protein product [Acanthoscelides obtectus]CAK1627349.1 hypothetical protein AOBTE_LOCUS4542 [Acanthoscelides obtectus]
MSKLIYAFATRKARNIANSNDKRIRDFQGQSIGYAFATRKARNIANSNDKRIRDFQGQSIGFLSRYHQNIIM